MWHVKIYLSEALFDDFDGTYLSLQLLALGMKVRPLPYLAAAVHNAVYK